MEPLLTARQVADLLQVHPITVYKWAQAGKLQSVKLGYLLRFPQEQFEKLVQKKAA